jgi:hypothetical protein
MEAKTMHAPRPRPRCATSVGAVIALSALLLGAGPPDGHDPEAGGDAWPADCPGRQAAQHEAPPMVRIGMGPYGFAWGYPAWSRRPAPRAPAASESYRAQVFHVHDCPPDPVGDRFVGLDALVTLMGHEGLKLYRSETASIDSGPDGIIAANDVVVVKINYQWPQRGGTNVDVLRGLVRRLADHPDGFTGEIVICENAQFASGHEFDRGESNAQNTAHSPSSVIAQFQAQGVNISHFAWGDIRLVEVDEYAQGDMVDGYVLLPYDPVLNGRVSYPKFRTSAGTYVSLRHGVWNTTGGTYDRDKLKFINMPVLKSHHAVYGATACVKNYMGVVSGSLGTNSHNAIANGILGAMMGVIRPADLNILDCIWVNGNPYSGPSTTYGGATRRDELVASTDPVAADRWAVTNILIPAFVDNGYSPPWPYPSADPDDPASQFRNYLDNSMNWLLLAGYDVTNHPPRIDVFTRSAGECPGDLDGDGAVGFGDVLDVIAAWGPCAACPEDLDGNGAVGFSDLLVLIGVWGPCG